jgi:hypothetical protein
MGGVYYRWPGMMMSDQPPTARGMAYEIVSDGKVIGNGVVGQLNSIQLAEIAQAEAQKARDAASRKKLADAIAEHEAREKALADARQAADQARDRFFDVVDRMVKAQLDLDNRFRLLNQRLKERDMAHDGIAIGLAVVGVAVVVAGTGGTALVVATVGLASAGAVNDWIRPANMGEADDSLLSEGVEEGLEEAVGEGLEQGLKRTALKGVSKAAGPVVDVVSAGYEVVSTQAGSVARYQTTTQSSLNQSSMDVDRLRAAEAISAEEQASLKEEILQNKKLLNEHKAALAALEAANARLDELTTVSLKR